MLTKRRWRWVAIGLPVLVFGGACLNCTGASGWQHHTEAARRLGLPAPSEGLHRLGFASTAIGGIVVGFGLVRRAE